MKISKYKIITLLVISSIAFWGKSAWESSSKRAKLNEQAIWIARYLGYQKMDFQAALRELENDKPYKTLDAKIWYQVETKEQNKTGSDVFIKCTEQVRGESPAIKQDLSITWTK